MIAKTLFRSAGLLALISATQLSAAQTQQCMTETEVRGLVAYAMPVLADAVVQRCGPGLPAGSFINTRGGRLVSDLRQGQSAAWPDARKAIIKIAQRDGDVDPALFDMPESVVSPMVDTMVQSRFAKDLKPQTCKDIDRILNPLAPLPAPNMIEAITQIVVLAARNDKKLPSCPGA